MGYCIIFKTKSDQLNIYHPVKVYKSEYDEDGNEIIKSENFIKIDEENFIKIPPHLIGLPFKKVNKLDIPTIDKNTCIEQLYFDGPVGTKNLKIDTNWEFNLMPTFKLKEKLKNKLNDIINQKMTDKSDTKELLSVMFEKNNLGTLKKEKLYQMALDQLDKSVFSGNADKPVIRKKLEKIINSKR
jgi:hypothetical protein